MLVSVPRQAQDLLFLPFELARFPSGETLRAAGIRLVYQVEGDASTGAAKPTAASLRILAAFSLPVQANPLSLRRERYGLQRLVAELNHTQGRALELRVLQYGATRAMLADALQEGEGWDIVYLSCHGGQGELLLEDFSLPATGLGIAFPEQPERFVGRLLPMLRASQALAAHSAKRGVLFYGMPGAGKTACALDLAYRHAEGRFIGHVWYKGPEEGSDIATALFNLLFEIERQLNAPGLGLTTALDDPQRFRQYTLPGLGDLLELLRTSGRLADALALAGLGPWTQLADESQRLQVLAAMGHYDEVLGEVERLSPQLAALPEQGEAEETVAPWNVREALLDTGLQAAVHSQRYEQALALNADIVQSKARRGAGPLQLARGRFNDYGPLLRLQRYPEARALLLECPGRCTRKRGPYPNWARSTAPWRTGRITPATAPPPCASRKPPWVIATKPAGRKTAPSAITTWATICSARAPNRPRCWPSGWPPP